MYCTHCERDLPTFRFCPVCGNPPGPQPNVTPEYTPQQAPPHQPQGQPPQNNYYNNNYYQNNPVLGTKSEALAIVLSVLILGVGQMYMGKVGRGIGILLGGIFLAVVGIFTAGVGYIVLLILFIWQIIDAYNLCKKYNAYLFQNGRPPW
ncbi:MAG: hypothetical protein ACRDV0_10670 [Acidimicrobiales bacterium]